MNILITLCARGGSKGIPGKNIRPINGSPLIVFSIDAAKKFASKYGADIGLSTDDDTIKRIASENGIITTYKRPYRFATDQAGKLDVIIDIMLSLILLLLMLVLMLLLILFYHYY